MFNSKSCSSLLLSVSLFTACTIYQSPERRTFESESPSFKIQSLQKTSCSNQSVKAQANQSRLVTIIETSSGTEALWEHIVNQQTNYESETSEKEYCKYEYKN